MAISGKRVFWVLTAAVLVLMLAGTSQAVVLFTADTDDAGTYPAGPASISVPAKTAHLPAIDAGVTLNPSNASMDGVATGPLNSITYGPGAYESNFGGTTGWVTASYTFTAAGPVQLVWEVANIGDDQNLSALAIDNISINGVLQWGFETGLPAGFTLLNSGGTSAAITNLAPVEGANFAWLDSQDIVHVDTIFDTIDGFNASRLYSAVFTVNAGDTLSMDLAFLSNDGTSEFHDYGIAEAQLVPLPGTLVLLGSGLLGLAGWRRRFR